MKAMHEEHSTGCVYIIYILMINLSVVVYNRDHRLLLIQEQGEWQFYTSLLECTKLTPSI
jgi:hypothetical protein